MDNNPIEVFALKQRVDILEKQVKALLDLLEDHIDRDTDVQLRTLEIIKSIINENEES